MSTKAQPPRFKVGDWVKFLSGSTPVVAQVIEDRGPIGLNRRRLYGIRLDVKYSEPTTFEMPEAELEPVVPDREAIRRYLSNGGLITLLQANMTGGRNQPRAWLTFTRKGDVVGTLDPERGAIGGQVVPFFALHEGPPGELKVFRAKRDAVIDFIMSFGLTRREAEEVIDAVGMAP